jgi:large subunit ribosomal protein L23
MAMMPDLYHAVVRPVVTEKSSAAYAARREYAFVVDPAATKLQIRAAIEHLFDVRVKKVRTAQQRKKRRSMGKTKGTRAQWKKAYVSLHEGDTIEIFEG